MAELKAGSVNDMANSMAQMIEDAMEREWSRAYPGASLSDQGKGDRAVLSAAIAQGVLGYLHENLTSLETDVVSDTSKGHKHHLTFKLPD